MEVIHLQWNSLSGEGSAYHVARHSGFVGASPLHTHDFAELFWVDQGRATHEINGHFDPLTEGDLVLILPEDVHRFRSPAEGFTLTNVAFPAEVLSELQSRYFTSTAPPWATGSGRKGDGLNPSDLRRIQEIGASLARVPSTRLHLDRMLLEVFAGVEAPAGIELPNWLREALSEWQRSPDAMAAGVGGLAVLAGRSREHVSRVVRQATGHRAIDVLNRLRLDTAAAQLRMTDRPIALIAIDVGLTNLSNFYRIFGATFGTTPRRYRLRHHQVIDPKP